VLVPEGQIIAASVNIECGVIAGIGAPAAGADMLDAAGGYVVPGLIDIHTHGIGMDSASGDLSEFAAREAASGATTFFPTLFGPPDELAACMARHLAETDSLTLVPNVGGFHLESPYLAKTGAGLAQDLAGITRPMTDGLLAAGGGHIRIWDISPELAGAAEEIAYLSGKGIVCGLAHTRASIGQARAAADAGARLVIHLFDTFEMPRDVSVSTGLYPAGLVDYLLIEDRLVCELLPDGAHVDPILVEKALRCKADDGVVFVTDGNLGAGLPPGEYELPQGWGRAKIEGPNNGVRLVDRGLVLAGSALTPIDCFRNAMKMFGLGMPDASRLCSLNPAALLGLNKGLIAEGRDADILVLDDTMNIRYAIAGGDILYEVQT
jgi:N-acetylglucosamine-6-phosphate deacetylase